MAGTPLPSWEVTSITPRTEFVAGMGPVEGYRVNYQTSSGITGFVFVSSTGLQDKDRIAAQIQTDVEHLHSIHTLSSGS